MRAALLIVALAYWGPLGLPLLCGHAVEGEAPGVAQSLVHDAAAQPAGDGPHPCGASCDGMAICSSAGPAIVEGTLPLPVSAEPAWAFQPPEVPPSEDLSPPPSPPPQA